MSPYNKPAVNMVEVKEGRRLVSRVDELKTHLIKIMEQLLATSLFPICDADYKHFLNNPQECEVLKTAIQELTDQGIMVVKHLATSEDVATLEILYDQVQPLQILYDMSPMIISDNMVIPLVIIVPTPFPFEDIKPVSWIYDSIVYIHGQKVQEKHMAINEPMVNISGTGGVTRNGAHIPPIFENGGT